MLQEQLLRQQKEEQKRICEGKPVVMKEILLLARTAFKHVKRKTTFF